MRPSPTARLLPFALAACLPLATRAQVEPPPIAPPVITKAPAPAAAASAATSSDGTAVDASGNAVGTAPEAPPKPDLALWEAGAFAFGAWQPAYPGSDQHLTKFRALPYVIYRGKVLRLEGGTIGVRAVRTPRYEWDLTGAFSFGGGANTVSARAGMPTIGTLVEAGPILRINLGDVSKGLEAARATRLELPVRGVYDLNDDLHGRGVAFEPSLRQQWWKSDTFTFNSTVGALLGSRKLNDLFYGVAPQFTTPERPAYTARGGLIALRAGVGLSYKVAKDVRIYWSGSVETVRGAANEDSPLVKAKQDLNLGVSISWDLWESKARAGAD